MDLFLNNFSWMIDTFPISFKFIAQSRKTQSILIRNIYNKIKSMK